MNNPTKSGFQTSEFYVALVGLIGIMANFFVTSCNITPDKFLALSGVIVTYILGRSWVKASAAQQPTSPVATQSIKVETPATAAVDSPVIV